MATMPIIPTGDPVAHAVTTAIRTGDLGALGRLLADHPGLAGAAVGHDGEARSLLHVVTDWPGHVPDVAAVVGLLVEAGADVDARFHGVHAETPLHWAASCDDVAAVDALLDAGADVDAPGAVIAGGTPLQDARSFRCWTAAHRLVERGARVDVVDAATLGLLDRLVDAYADPATTPSADETDLAFWSACHGGRLEAARFLLERGADLDRVAPWEPKSPLDAAGDAGSPQLVTWLRARGARLAREQGGS